MQLTVLQPPQRSKGLFVVLLPTLECNLRCTYCFEDHPKGRWDLAQTRHVLEQIVLLARSESATFVRLHWQGGEAMLLGVDWFREVLPMAERIFADARLGIDQTLQTNLVLYSEEWAPLVHRYLGGHVGTSFEDGAGRCNAVGDSGAFVRAWTDAHRRAVKDGILVSVISVLNDAMLDEGAESYLERMRSDYGITRLRISLPFQHPGTPGHWVDPDRAGEFLADAYRAWRARGRDDFMRLGTMRYLEERLWTGDTEEPELCLFARNCNDVALTIGTRGDVSLCDIFLFTGQADHFGNVFEEPLPAVYRGRKRKHVGHLCESLLQPECHDCRYLPICHGGCLVRSHGAPEGNPKFHYCSTYKRWFSAIEAAPR